VVPAAHHERESVSPFDDPFGDRLAQSAGQPESPPEAPREGQIQQAAPPASIDPPGIDAVPLEPQPAEPPLPGDGTEQSTADDATLQPPVVVEPAEPPPAGLSEPDDQQPIINGEEATKEEQPPCDQVYADRNFHEEQSECREGWEDLEENPLSSISLNISPNYEADEDGSKMAEVRHSQLGPNAEREWRNRWNRPLGIGPDGTVYGLDGEDWELKFASSLEPDRPRLLVGSWQRDSDDGYDAIVDAKYVVDEDTEEKKTMEVRLPWDKLSRDDNYFVKGRPWVDRLGRDRGFGRLEDYRNGDVYIRTSDGETKTVPFLALNEDAMSWVAAYWKIPAECKLPDVLREMPQDQLKLRDYTLITYTWKASGLCHKPLYFEERALERYGHSTGPISQPVLSGAHFFTSFFALPYMMGMNPPHECMYALGYYRPGSCAPYQVPPIPLSARGALLQAGTVVGLVYLLP
jgi:hypothetical protein